MCVQGASDHGGLTGGAEGMSGEVETVKKEKKKKKVKKDHHGVTSKDKTAQPGASEKTKRE